MNKNRITTFWHGRMLFITYLYRFQQRYTVLVSPSNDGDMISGIIRNLGISVVRGSSYKGGTKAFLKLIRIVKNGGCAGLISDGSRGPRYKVQGGIIDLARLTGAPIIPLTYSAKRKKVFKSWDRFILPYPFTRIVVIYGEPLYLHRDATQDIVEDKRKELEDRLNKITLDADRYFYKCSISS
ncbi:MAG: lysophospholipid acyltransferase family protein [Nitrospinae bacterium]|nr:lysophospholipid acyltransferase family protein [Nitrospinota bacterium]